VVPKTERKLATEKSHEPKKAILIFSPVSRCPSVNYNFISAAESMIDVRESLWLRGCEYEVELISSRHVRRLTIVLRPVQSNGEQSGGFEGQMAAQFVHEMTRQTGNYKEFERFVEMLDAAASGKSKSCRLDLLSAQDLNLPSSTSHSGASGAASTSVGAAGGSAGGDKMYLVLSYCTEFDQTFYPIPLHPVNVAPIARRQPPTNQLLELEQKQESEQKQETVKKQKEESLVRENLELKRQLSEIISERSAVEQAFSQVQRTAREEFHKLQLQLARDSQSETHLERLYATVESMLQSVSDRQGEVVALKEALAVAEMQVKLVRQEFIDQQIENERLHQLLNERTDEIKRLRQMKQQPQSTRSTPQRFNHQRRQSAELQVKQQQQRTEREIRRSNSLSSVKSVQSVASSRKSSQSSNVSNVGKRFKRFDPTAYVRDKQEKLRERSASRASSRQSTRSSIAGSISAGIEERLQKLTQYFSSLKTSSSARSLSRKR
jgi:coiled-coil domain-containing protein 61